MNPTICRCCGGDISLPKNLSSDDNLNVCESCVYDEEGLLTPEIAKPAAELVREAA